MENFLKIVKQAGLFNRDLRVVATRDKNRICSEKIQKIAHANEEIKVAFGTFIYLNKMALKLCQVHFCQNIDL